MNQKEQIESIKKSNFDFIEITEEIYKNYNMGFISSNELGKQVSDCCMLRNKQINNVATKKEQKELFIILDYLAQGGFKQAD